jgi:hypothetical protein
MVSRCVISFLTFILAFLGCVTVALAQTGPSPSTATGTFTVNGKTVALKHVYALIKPDLFHDEKDALYVVLSDAPIEESKLRSPLGLVDEARAGTLHAIEVKFDDDAQPNDGELYNNNFKDAANVSVSGMHKFVPRHFEAGKLIAGKLYVEPQSSFGDEDKWVYSATFSAPIMPKPVEKLAALDSPPALAVRAFLRAIATKNKEAIKKTIMPNMASELDGPHGAEMMAILPAMFDSKLKITKVVMHGDDKAEVILKEAEKGSNSTTTVTTGKLNGEWRVSRE